jgi:hypothetical protein|tara:strand:+ start:409 stop:717 length:309 start_codon:yes stop_codon:yes gene_type:complete
MNLFNITSATTTTLIPLYKNRNSVKSVRFTNTHASTAVNVQLFLEDDASTPNKYYILDTDIPGQTTLLLDQDLSFDNTSLALKLTTSAGGLDASNPLTVIVK